MKPLIRRAAPDDLAQIEEIERASFPNSAWQQRDFLANECIVAEVDGRIAGFLVSRQVFPGDGSSPPQWEIMNVAVSPAVRRKGIASSLLRSLFDGPAEFFLEVRESNVAALSLYSKFGFTEVGRRRGYYEYPAETAIVMKMKWC